MRHPSFFVGQAREWAYEDQDECPDKEDPNETVQTTIIATRLTDTR
jgi:hypothetical protein